MQYYNSMKKIKKWIFAKRFFLCVRPSVHSHTQSDTKAFVYISGAGMKRVKIQEDPVAGGSGGVDLKKVKKHTLDSDEEDSSDEENQKQ